MDVKRHKSISSFLLGSNEPAPIEPVGPISLVGGRLSDSDFVCDSIASNLCQIFVVAGTLHKVVL